MEGGNMISHVASWKWSGTSDVYVRLHFPPSGACRRSHHMPSQTHAWLVIFILATGNLEIIVRTTHAVLDLIAFA